jgi:DNA-binding transcriptional regulator YiaG
MRYSSEYHLLYSLSGDIHYPESKTLPEQLVSQRRRLGLSVKKAAKKIGVDEGTFSRWERGTWKPRRCSELIGRFLKEKQSSNTNVRHRK